MNILFYGFRHAHIFGCYESAEKHSDINILSAIEENETARLSAQTKLNITIEAGGYEASLLNPALDAVAIGSAYGDRGQAVIKALQHGKHVLCDKPVCTSLEELDAICRLSKEKNLKVGCLLDLRKIPPVIPVKMLLQSGRMGIVKNITFSGQHCIDYANRPAWYFEPGKHGGTINDIAIHGIDLIPYLTGHKIDRLYCARTWNSFAYRHPHFDDCATFMAETDAGAGVLADVSYAAPRQVFSMPTYWNFQIWCEKGLVTFCCAEENVTVYEDGADKPEIIPGIPAESHILDDFLWEISKNTTSFTDSVLFATRTALRIQQAADTSKNNKGVCV